MALVISSPWRTAMIITHSLRSPRLGGFIRRLLRFANVKQGDTGTNQ